MVKIATSTPHVATVRNGYMWKVHREQELETYIDKSNLSIVVGLLLPTYYDAHVKLMDVFSARVVLQFNQRIFVSVGFFCEKAHTHISSNRRVFGVFRAGSLLSGGSALYIRQSSSSEYYFPVPSGETM